MELLLVNVPLHLIANIFNVPTFHTKRKGIYTYTKLTCKRRPHLCCPRGKELTSKKGEGLVYDLDNPEERHCLVRKVCGHTVNAHLVVTL